MYNNHPRVSPLGVLKKDGLLLRSWLPRLRPEWHFTKHSEFEDLRRNADLFLRLSLSFLLQTTAYRRLFRGYLRRCRERAIAGNLVIRPKSDNLSADIPRPITLEDLTRGL